MKSDFAIIGSGIGGLSAGIYAGRYNMKTVIIGEEFGGETARAGVIWNYPGVKAADGYELVSTMRDQAKENGATFLDGRVTEIMKNDAGYELLVGEKRISAKAALFALGTVRKKLNLPREKELINRGVHYCVTCDGPLYSHKRVAVVGGGNASLKGANLLCEFADKVYVIVRGKEMRAEPVLVEKLKKHGSKAEILLETQVTELVGDKILEKIRLSKEYSGSYELALDGLFVEIGAMPEVEIVTSLGVALDKEGYIIVDNRMQTNVPGLFAAGDATNFFGSFKQCIAAAAMGAVSAASAYKFVKDDNGGWQLEY